MATTEYLVPDHAAKMKNGNSDWWSKIRDKYEGYRSKAKDEWYRLPLIALQDAVSTIYNDVFPLLSKAIEKAYDAVKFALSMGFLFDIFAIAKTIVLSTFYLVPVTALAAFLTLTGVGQGFAEKCWQRARDFATNNIGISAVAGTVSLGINSLASFTGFISLSRIVGVVFPVVPLLSIMAAVVGTIWHKQVNKVLNNITDKLAEYGLWSKAATNANKASGVPHKVDLVGGTVSISSSVPEADSTQASQESEEDNHLLMASTAGSLLAGIGVMAMAPVSTPILVAAAAVGATTGEEFLNIYRHRQAEAAAAKDISAPPVTTPPAASEGLKKVSPSSSESHTPQLRAGGF